MGGWPPSPPFRWCCRRSPMQGEVEAVFSSLASKGQGGNSWTAVMGGREGKGKGRSMPPFPSIALWLSSSVCLARCLFSGFQYFTERFWFRGYGALGALGEEEGERSTTVLQVYLPVCLQEGCDGSLSYPAFAMPAGLSA